MSKEPRSHNEGRLQIIIAIRHGQSEYNAACQTRGPHGWSDPQIFDPHLTALGVEQTRRLRKRLHDEMTHNPLIAEHPDSVLWVTSPLQRCLQTFLLSCPLLPNLEPDGEAKFKSPNHIRTQLEKLRGTPLPNIRVARCALAHLNSREM